MANLRQHIIDALQTSSDALSRRDLARMLNIKGDDRRMLRSELSDLIDAGLLVKSKNKTYRLAGELPGVMVLRVTHTDEHGDYVAVPDKWNEERPRPEIRVKDTSRKGGKHKRDKGTDLGVGVRVLCRISTSEAGHVGQVLKKLGRGATKHLGVLYQDGRGWSVRPVDKKVRDEARPTHVAPGTRNHELVQYRNAGRKGQYERKVEILKYLGPADGPKAFTMISLEQHGVPVGFDDEVLREAENLALPKLDKFREDLRHIPLLTIDPEDAKDFDDAIFATLDDDPKNPKGWIIWVAIADVAAFVQPDSALDKAARHKGNSVYLPDRVEPMLPEALSADLCSLRPNEDRACMAVRMIFNAKGEKLGQKFTRGLMRSHARLTYAQAQSAFDGHPELAAEPVLDTLTDIFAAYKCLRDARKKRAPLEIDLPERRVKVNADGEVEAITIRDRFDAHKLVEEFMVQANVAAAESLAAKGVQTLVRVHEPPAHEKLQGLSEFLPVIGMSWSMGERATPARFNRLLEKAKDEDLSETVGMVVLRSQSQAYYAPDSLGHFGLNLAHYAHFTSPIRRYADLVVHRALIRTFKLGHDGTTEAEMSRLKGTGEHISDTERRAMAAERDAKDRYVARFLEKRVGSEFEALISGVAKAGLFLTLSETGADGFIPVRTLSEAYFVYDETKKSLINSDTGGTYRIGQRVNVRLREATPVTGGLLFEMLTPPEKGSKPKRSGRNTTKGRGPKPGRRKRRRS